MTKSKKQLLLCAVFLILKFLDRHIPHDREPPVGIVGAFTEASFVYLLYIRIYIL